MTKAPFPLTPALSLGERESRIRFLGNPARLNQADGLATILPLPWGEGRGEGAGTLGMPIPLRTRPPPVYSERVTPPKLTRVARMLRKKDTWAEKVLWSWLRERRFSSY